MDIETTRDLEPIIDFEATRLFINSTDVIQPFKKIIQKKIKILSPQIKSWNEEIKKIQKIRISSYYYYV